MKSEKPEIRLERLVNALADDLADASDLELIDAAESLRMILTQRASAAFLGLKGLVFPYRPSKFWAIEPADERESRRGMGPRPEKP